MHAAVPRQVVLVAEPLSAVGARVRLDAGVRVHVGAQSARRLPGVPAHGTDVRLLDERPRVAFRVTAKSLRTVEHLAAQDALVLPALRPAVLVRVRRQSLQSPEGLAAERAFEGDDGRRRRLRSFSSRIPLLPTSSSLDRDRNVFRSRTVDALFFENFQLHFDELGLYFRIFHRFK